MEGLVNAGGGKTGRDIGVSDSVLAILCFALGVFCLWTIMSGFRTGVIQLMSRIPGVSAERAQNAALFWIIAISNAAFALLLIGGSLMITHIL